MGVDTKTHGVLLLSVFLGIVRCQDPSRWAQWTEDDVADWLRKIRFERYCDAFITNDIDGECLSELSGGALKELGVESVGHRIKLMRELRKLLGIPQPASPLLNAVLCSEHSTSHPVLSDSPVGASVARAPPTDPIPLPTAVPSPRDTMPWPRDTVSPPSKAAPVADEGVRFEWRTQAWGPCAATCGNGGTQVRTVTCHAMPTGVQVPPMRNCQAVDQPASLRTCNQTSLPLCTASTDAQDSRSSIWCVWKRNRSCALGEKGAQRLLNTEMKQDSTRMDCQRLCLKFSQPGCCWFRYTPELPPKCQFASNVLEHNDDFQGSGLDSAICK